MANFQQNGAPMFVVSGPTANQGLYYASPSPGYIYPQMYTTVQQQQQPPTSCTNSDLVGRTSVIVLGVALIVCGVTSQAGASVGFRFYAGLSEVGVGIWCGYAFFAAGVVAIVTAHHETKKLIIGTIVTSALAVVAAIIQLIVASVGLARDDYHYSGDWGSSAIGANVTIVIAACLALVGSVWLLYAACLAVQKEQASFQVASSPDQFIPCAAQPNIYESGRTEQINSTNFRQVQQHQQQHQRRQQQRQQQHHQHQQRQQPMPLNYPHPNDINLPMDSQVLQMPVASIPLQTMTTPTNPNQQVLQVPAQFVLNALQQQFNEEIRNQQMLSMPTQFVTQLQQPTALNNSPANAIDPVTPSRLHRHNKTRKEDDRDVDISLRIYPKINTAEKDADKLDC